MIARNIAPGLLRMFAFEHFSHYNEAEFRAVYDAAQAKSYPDKPFVIF